MKLMEVLKSISGKKHLIYLSIFFLGILCLLGLLFWIKESPNVMLVTRFIALPKLFGVGGFFWAIFLCLLYFISNKFHVNINKVNILFYIAMMLFILGCFLAGALTHGEAIRSFLFSDRQDTFMDFYNSIQYGMKPYMYKTIYPPFINSLYGFLGQYVRIEKITEHAYEIRNTQMGLVLFGMYSSIIYLGLAFLISRIKQGNSIEKIIFMFVLLFSVPFLFAFERGNSIILALFFMLFFIFYYKSENRFLRYLSYVALGLASGIKIAPAILGLLILRERRYKETLIAFVICTLVFMLPFYLTDGNIFTLIKNLSYTTSLYQGYYINDIGKMLFIGHGAFVNLNSTVTFFGRLFNINLLNLSRVLTYSILSLGILIILVDLKLEKWKVIGILTGLLVLIPGFSGVYNLIYMVLPLMLFLDTEKNVKKNNILYLVLFIFMFLPIVNFKLPCFRQFELDIYPLKITTVIESISILLFVILLEVSSIINYLKKIQTKGMNRVCNNIIIYGIFCVMGSFVIVIGFNKKSVDAFYPYNLDVVNASKGFFMEQGFYYGIDKSGSIILNSKKIKEKGLMISFLDNYKNIEFTDRIIDLYIDNMFVTEKEITPQNHNIYIEPDYICKLKLGKTVNISVKEKNNDNKQKKCYINYMGPAELISSVKNSTYIDNASNGIFRLRQGREIWLSESGNLLLNANELREGFIIRYKAPLELFAMNPQKNIKLNIMISGKHVKSVAINSLRTSTVIIQPDDIKKATLDNDLSLINLQLSVNASFTGADFGIISDIRKRSLMIQYIGNCEKDPAMKQNVQEHFAKSNKEQYNFRNVYLNRIHKEHSFYFNTKDICNSGVSMIYSLPMMMSSDDENKHIELEIFVDGKIAKRKMISTGKTEDVNAVTISPDFFDGEQHIAKIEVVLKNANLIKDDRNVIISYLGKDNLLAKLYAKKEEMIFANGFNYDTSSQNWRMGSRGILLLAKHESTNKTLNINFSAKQYLFDANPNKEIILNVYCNGILIKEFSLKQRGNYTFSEQIPSKILENEDCLKILFTSNCIYNLSDMQLLPKELDDRSINVDFVGWK